AGRWKQRRMLAWKKFQTNMALRLKRANANQLIGGNDFRRAQRHRAEQARLQQRRILRPVMPCGERQPARRTGLAIEKPLRPSRELLAVPLAIRRQLLVPDEPVW